MPTSPPEAVTVQFDGDVWRATLGPHAANATDPYDAITLVAGKAREAGFQFGAKPASPAPSPPPAQPSEPAAQ